MTVDIKRLELFLLGILLGPLIVSFEYNLLAKDLGVIGKVYIIEEKDLIEEMQKKLVEKQKNGELAKEMMGLKDKAEKLVKRPLGVNLPQAKEYVTRSITVSYRLPQDITDANGKILYKADTVVNPLRIRTLSKSLCFFDGDDKKQVDWVMKHCGENQLNKLIMTNGPFLELSNKYQKRFYFDQQGILVARLGIEALPAVVKQKGDLLYVEEFPIN